MADLSVIIPARNEIFLVNTVEDLLKNIRGDTEIIVVLDGNWPDPPVKDHPKVTLIHHSQSIGQRGACNEAAKYSRAKYIAKCDAHCSFDEGFDVKLMEDMQNDWTIVPIMRNLHAFDWVCENGHRRYQGPSGPCQYAIGKEIDKNTGKEKNTLCGKPTTREMKWIGKNNPQSTVFVFDPEPHFQYGNAIKDRHEYKKAAKEVKLTETMSLQGSFFMMTKEKYFELGMNDEAFGNWGSQGLEIAIRTWTSGGKVICSHKTWYSHMFRTQGADFGFPWECSGRQVDRAKKRAKQIFFKQKWGPQQIYPLSWLVERFWPTPYWKEKDLNALKEDEKKFWTKDGTFVDAKVIAEEQSDKSEVPVKEGEMPSQEASNLEDKKVAILKGKTGVPSKALLYYTDNRLEPRIMALSQKSLLASCNGHKILSVSLKPMDFAENVVLNLQRGYLTMAKQQLAGLKLLDAEIVFFVEHDCVYPKEHFSFVPPRKDVFYYDLAWWKVRSNDGQALHFRACQVSGLCAYRDILIEYFQNRVRMIESGEIGGRRHFEPGNGPHHDAYDKLTTHGFDTWYSEIPYIDIRHEGVVTRSIFDPKGYRGRVKDWTPSESVPSWGKSLGRFSDFLKEVEAKLEATNHAVQTP
jgi:hypothetical protein